MTVSPTEEGRVGSGFGERTSSRTGRVTFHAGWDFVAPRKTVIYAAERGVVEQMHRERPGGPMRGYGNAAVVRHSDGTRALYAHLESFHPLLREGLVLEAGSKIGLAGNTTNGAFPRMPPHLHFEVRRPKEDGSSPFPGAYGRYNVDPKTWFETKGLVIGNRFQSPPGMLMPGAGAGLSELGLGMIFPPCPHGMGVPCRRCALGPLAGLGVEVYKPGVDPVGAEIWEWRGTIVGSIVLGGLLLLSRQQR